MGQLSQDDVTRLLARIAYGEREAFGTLMPLLYEELHALAHRQRQRWQGDNTLNTTALIHEAYLKLVGNERATWANRAHFLAVAARAMRHILINYSRDRRAQKRGGNDVPVASLEELGSGLAEAVDPADDHGDILIAVDEALEKLEQVNPRQSRIVECRFFGGMTIEETAVALGVSTATVSRGWATAQARLYEELRHHRPPPHARRAGKE